jgi:hypothetical protein
MASALFLWILLDVPVAGEKIVLGESVLGCAPQTEEVH